MCYDRQNKNQGRRVNFCTLLKELVEEGRVSMERIDDATRRVLRLKYRLGLFKTPRHIFQGLSGV